MLFMRPLVAAFGLVRAVKGLPALEAIEQKSSRRLASQTGRTSWLLLSKIIPAIPHSQPEVRICRKSIPPACILDRGRALHYNPAHSCRQSRLVVSMKISHVTTGANTLTLRHLACHSRLRPKSDATYRAAVRDLSISAEPATADEVEPWSQRRSDWV